MVQHTSTVVAVPSQADTQKSPVGIAWSTNALTACSLGIRSQDSPPSHGPIVLRCPGNGREPPMGTVINPQRDLMQDVGPEVLLHVPALLPCSCGTYCFEPIRTPLPYYKNGTNCHERILGRCTCKRNKGSKGCWGRLIFGGKYVHFT